MARMHSRKKGKSGSKKPLHDEKLTWLRYGKKEAALLVQKLAKSGKSTSEIGLILRDTYGIPDVKKVTGKSVSQILEEKDLLPELPENLLDLMKKYAAIKQHLSENHKDKTAGRGLRLTDSKIRRLIKYYKKSGKLESGWKYDPTKIRFYIE